MSETVVGWRHKEFIKLMVDTAKKLGFPDPSDRSRNQPSVIIQPNVVEKIISDVRNSVSLEITMLGDPNFIFEDCLEHFFKSDGFSPEDYNVRLFCNLSPWLGWSTLNLTGRQVILTEVFPDKR